MVRERELDRYCYTVLLNLTLERLLSPLSLLPGPRKTRVTVMRLENNLPEREEREALPSYAEKAGNNKFHFIFCIIKY